MPRSRSLLTLDASIQGEHLHLDCRDCDCAASVIDYSVPDGFLEVECSGCGRTGRLKLWQHALWQSKGHGETGKEYREGVAAFNAEHLRTRKQGDPALPKPPARKRRVKR